MTGGGWPRRSSSTAAYRKLSAILRAARREEARASPPSAAMRFFSAADNRLPRARPPLLPSALAIWDTFTGLFYLALSKKSIRGSRHGVCYRGRGPRRRRPRRVVDRRCALRRLPRGARPGSLALSRGRHVARALVWSPDGSDSKPIGMVGFSREVAGPTAALRTPLARPRRNPRTPRPDGRLFYLLRYELFPGGYP